MMSTRTWRVERRRVSGPKPARWVPCCLDPQKNRRGRRQVLSHPLELGGVVSGQGRGRGGANHTPRPARIQKVGQPPKGQSDGACPICVGRHSTWLGHCRRDCGLDRAVVHLWRHRTWCRQEDGGTEGYRGLRGHERHRGRLLHNAVGIRKWQLSHSREATRRSVQPQCRARRLRDYVVASDRVGGAVAVTTEGGKR